MPEKGKHDRQRYGTEGEGDGAKAIIAIIIAIAALSSCSRMWLPRR